MKNIDYTYWPLNKNGPLNDIIFDSNFIYECIFRPKEKIPSGLIRKTVKSLVKKNFNKHMKEMLSIKDIKKKDIAMVVLLSNSYIGRKSLKNFDTNLYTTKGDFNDHLLHGGIKSQIEEEKDFIRLIDWCNNIKDKFRPILAQYEKKEDLKNDTINMLDNDFRKIFLKGLKNFPNKKKKKTRKFF